jgi:SAM-dependent methyltransferase
METITEKLKKIKALADSGAEAARENARLLLGQLEETDVNDDSPSAIDLCCGTKMFYFDKENPDVCFLDNRDITLKYDKGICKNKPRVFEVKPDLKCDFTDLPFDNESFKVVIFDPPHLLNVGKKSYMALKYGKLDEDFETQLRSGFEEGFRVLKKDGILIFKWNETQIPVSKILALTPHKPLIGQRCGKSAKTHWIIFKK